MSLHHALLRPGLRLVQLAQVRLNQRNRAWRLTVRISIDKNCSLVAILQRIRQIEAANAEVHDLNPRTEFMRR